MTVQHKELLPAILGGDAVRTRPFVVGPMIDDEEEKMVLAAIREHNFSRYIGADSSDIETILRMPSAEAVKIEAPWHFLGGPNVRIFAADFAAMVGVRFGIPVNAATSGISVALASLNIGPGDEVIVPGLSFSASGAAVLLFNSVPVFVDVDPVSFCIDAKNIESAITSRTKAILVVHLLGNACNMDEIMKIARKHDLKVVEDCAQAPGVSWNGKKVGSFGDAGVFSFQQSKNIMTGEGGMITTDNPEVASKCRLILNHGETVMKMTHADEDLINIVGCNFRMPELCAALGRAQLKKLDTVNRWRNENARYLIDRLSSVTCLKPPVIDERVDWVCHVLAFLFDAEAAGLSRETFVAALRAEGVPVGTGYVKGMYENPLFLKRIGFGGNGCPWKCRGEESAVTYDREQCPTIRDLIDNKFLWFYHVAYPSTREDMDDIIAAVKKVLQAAPLLRENEEKIKMHGDTSKRQGRIL